MIRLRRHILPLLLSLLIVLTGQAVAVAEGAPAPSGRIEACHGSGVTMIWVDENGNPTGPPVLCPKFALSLILALDLPPVTAPAVRGAVHRLGRPRNLRPGSRPETTAAARDPPAFSDFQT